MTLRAFLTRLIWLCVLPGFLIASWLAITHMQDLRNEIDGEGERLVGNAASAIDQYLGARIDALQVLASSPLADDRGRWPDLYAEAQGLSRSFGGPVIVRRLDDDSIFHTAVPLAAPLPPFPRPVGVSAFETALATGRPAVGDSFVGPLEKEPVIAIAVPGMRDGKTTHVVFNVANGSRLASRIGELSLPANWSLKVSDSRGVPIAQVGPVRAEAAAGDATFTAAPKLAPWQVELTMPRGDRLVPMVNAAVAMAIAIAGALAVSVFGGQWASRRLARAVRSLADESVPGPPASTITEIRAVRQLLEQASRARDDAERARRESEGRHRADLEQASIALQVREAQLRGIFDSASDAILTVDESQTIVMANHAAARVFRSRVDALLGAPLDGLIAAPVRARHRDLVEEFGRAEAIARPMGHRSGATGLRADGEEFPIEGAISQVHVDGQRLFTVILRDITERQRAEQDLRTSKAKLEAALASMNDAIYIADADGRLVDFNDAFVSFHRFKGRGECEAAAPDYADTFEVWLGDGAPAPVSQRPVPRALRGEVGSLVDYRLRRNDSGESWIGSYSYAPMRDPDGRITGAVVTARDITELRHVQSELEASHADLRRLVAAQDRVQEAERKRIARELHDDLQQTLAAILMESTAMRSEPEHSAVSALEGLVRIDRLATAAIASTRRVVNDLRPQMLEELGLVPALEALARRFTANTGIACEVVAEGFDAHERGAVGSVATCLFRVAQEALNNVAKHANARHVRIDLHEHTPARWRLSIHDDGTGLTERGQRKQGAFGLLGMRERVHAVGGTIRLDSESGAGTTVEVEVGQADSVDTASP